MARTMTRNQNPKAPIRKRSKTIDDSAVEPWLTLNHDVLFLILMKLGVIDFIAFSGVCKTWRAFAFSIRNTFLASRQPMVVTIPPRCRRACYLVDYDGRTFKTLLPNFSGRYCVGLANGYLIMSGRRIQDFLLINPITRHQLYFPAIPFSMQYLLTKIRAILVFSATLSSYVLVIIFRTSNVILYIPSHESASWGVLYSSLDIYDLHFFKGKIYILYRNCTFSELRLNPHATLVPLSIKNTPEVPLHSPALISSSDKLYLISVPVYWVLRVDVALELDADNMEWVESSLRGNCAVYYGFSKCSAIVESTRKHSSDADIESYFLRCVKILGAGMNDMWNERLNIQFTPIIWYFPHECVNVDFLEE